MHWSVDVTKRPRGYLRETPSGPPESLYLERLRNASRVGFPWLRFRCGRVWIGGLGAGTRIALPCRWTIDKALEVRVFQINEKCWQSTPSITPLHPPKQNCIVNTIIANNWQSLDNCCQLLAIIGQLLAIIGNRWQSLAIIGQLLAMIVFNNTIFFVRV